MDQSCSPVEPDPIAFLWACVLEALAADGNPSSADIVRRAAAAGLVLAESTLLGWFEPWPATPKKVVPQWRTFEPFIKALSAEKDRDWKALLDTAQRAKNEALRQDRKASPPSAGPGLAQVSDASPGALPGSGTVSSHVPEAVVGGGDADGGQSDVPTPRPSPRLHSRWVMAGVGLAVALLALGVWTFGSGGSSQDPPTGDAAVSVPVAPVVAVSSARCDRYAVAPVDLWLRDEYGTVATRELAQDDQVTVLDRPGPTGGKYWRVATGDGISGWVDHTYLRPLCAT
jgi:hypothetical protein